MRIYFFHIFTIVGLTFVTIVKKPFSPIRPINIGSYGKNCLPLANFTFFKHVVKQKKLWNLETNYTKLEMAEL